MQREADIAQGTSDDLNSAAWCLREGKFYAEPVKPSTTLFVFAKRH